MSSLESFLIVISTQLSLYLFIVWKKQYTRQTTFKILWKSLLLGLFFGVVFDLLAGEYLGMYTYPGMGFTFPFLLFNAVFSWGIWVATIDLFSSCTLRNFILQVFAVTVVYEVVNFFFPVWQWTFSSHPLMTIGIVPIGYTGLALLTALISSKFLEGNFKLFT